MAVITISRELGSEGREIGQRVADELNYRLVDRSTMEGVFRQYGLTKFDDLTTSVPNLWDIINADNLLIVAMLNEIVEALATIGNVVILGRGGFAVLNEYEDVLTVRVQAPPPVRAQRIMDRRKLATLQEAEEVIKQDDVTRGKFVQMFYAKRWDQETHFDLVVDTGTLSSNMAVNWIIEAARTLEEKKFAKDAITTSKIEVDPVLMDAVTKAMEHPLPPLPND